MELNELKSKIKVEPVGKMESEIEREGKKIKHVNRIVHLPAGLKLEDGLIARAVTLKEMTGEQENEMQTGGAQAINKLLKGCIESIEGVDVVTDDMILDMLASDRDFLFVKIRQLNFGDDVRVETACPKCKNAQTVNYKISDLDVKVWPDEFPRVIEGIEVAQGVANIASGEMQNVFSVAFATGHDQMFVLKKGKEYNEVSLLLSQVIKKAGNMKSISYDMALKMWTKDRLMINKAMSEVQSGIDDGVEVICGDKNCKHKFKVNVVNSENFFSLT